ncbi:putative spermidine/putrescine transport system permease protein [Faunimonas pinastri]|uniref:Putative spermidine/putrescine transport system permease protein n=1 Tax=Faunimonas pinastri TaxID=1855383 RepID=A0A1H9KAG1_9HYPH|nr:ABC transporter permease [Faunimonas pinastri]SEQ96099.1 putative spermidine/putrescine transport system permease protein [Faunimonas pinastri]
MSSAHETLRRGGVPRRFSGLLWRNPRLGLGSLLAPPLAWFILIYLAALVVLFVAAFWSVDPFTGELDRTWTLDNFRAILTSDTYRAIALRTVAMAAAVTVTDAVLAFPFAYYMARVAGPKLRVALFALVLLPLWSSYLARVYAWRLILSHDGVLNWALKLVGLPQVDIGYSRWAMWIVFTYIWLPFMIMPLYAALERIPGNFFEASGDLGARGWRTTAKIVFPLALPGLIAGSIFTFSLTLGDYITPVLVGGPGSDFIGNVVYANVGIANNVPFAAAYATLPLLVMAIYLLVARRLGAFDMM